MIHDYPYTNLHELNLDYIMKLCRETMGLHFEQADKFLKLVNQAGEEVSKVKIFYAETALKDDDGNVISTYLIDAGVDGNNLVFDRGNGEIITLTVPYASKANKDVNNVDLTSYVHGVGVSGNKILVTFGDGNTYSFTVPFATKALGDENGKNITTYVAELSTSNDKLIVTDGAGVTLAEITIPYAVKALNDVDGDPIKSTYATLLTTDTTTVALKAKDGSVLSTITVPYAVKALTDTEGNTLLGDYGYHLSTNGNKVVLEAHNGTTLNEITVPFATLANSANDGIASIAVSGDEIVFTTVGGTVFRITAPYAVKSQKDSLNNTITHAYVASVTNDPDTGELSFYASDGTLLATLTPTVDEAVHDSYSNLIADYVKEIIVDPQNNYMVVNHGTGDSDTLTINYSTHAYKDTYENVIGNTYIRSLSIVEDAVDHHEYLVAYNGELSELFRIDLNDLSAVTSLDDLTDVTLTTPANGDILVYDSNINTWVNKEHIKNPYVVIDYTSLGTIELTDSTTSVNLGAPVNIYGYTSENKNRESITISELVKRVQKGANVVLQIPFSQGAGRFWLSNIQYDSSIMSGNNTLVFNGIVTMETTGHNYECEVSINAQSNLYTLTVKSVVDTVENDFIIFEAGQSVTSATELKRIYNLLQRGKVPFFKTTNMMILPLDSYMCSKSGVSIPLTTTISEFAKMTHPTSSPYDALTLVFYQKAGSGTSFQADSKSIQVQFNGSTLNVITVPS